MSLHGTQYEEGRTYDGYVYDSRFYNMCRKLYRRSKGDGRSTATFFEGEKKVICLKCGIRFNDSGWGYRTCGKCREINSSQSHRGYSVMLDRTRSRRDEE